MNRRRNLVITLLDSKSWYLMWAYRAAVLMPDSLKCADHKKIFLNWIEIFEFYDYMKKWVAFFRCIFLLTLFSSHLWKSVEITFSSQPKVWYIFIQSFIYLFILYLITSPKKFLFSSEFGLIKNFGFGGRKNNLQHNLHNTPHHTDKIALELTVN